MIFDSKNDNNEYKIYDLDTAAKIYAYTKTKVWNQVYRVSVTLNDVIDPEKLLLAISDIRMRFPTFHVQLCKKFSWRKLRTVENTKILVKDDGQVCKPIEIGNTEKPMFRVIYTDYTVSVEFFHSVTDGTGALCYIKTLLAAYFERCGITIKPGNGVLNYHEEYIDEETENSFYRYYQEHGEKIGRKEALAYQYNANEIIRNKLRVFHINFSVEDLKRVIHPLGVSATEFLAAAYTYAFLVNRPLDNNKPVKIEIPINLRRLFPSQTLRNFSLYTNVTTDLPKDECTMKNILDCITPQFRKGSSKEELQKIINTNVCDEKMPIVDYIPSIIKLPVLRIGSMLYGERLFTSPLSNLGVINVPDEMKPLIKDFDFVIGPTILNKIYATSCSYNGQVKVTISSLYTNSVIVTDMLKFIRMSGIESTLVSSDSVLSI